MIVTVSVTVPTTASTPCPAPFSAPSMSSEDASRISAGLGRDRLERRFLGLGAEEGQAVDLARDVGASDADVRLLFLRERVGREVAGAEIVPPAGRPVTTSQ
jgi:hypothetical protein